MSGERDAGDGHFRPDIEGLRAVAVLLVVGYHARIPHLSGGFIGVDVFFVLSGYLITGLLANEFGRTATISLRRFYARRARRLLPAATLMIAATLAAGLTMLTPHERIRLSSAAVSTALYASNAWFFLADSDYFADDAHANPLLHTWSLGVEEQFYFAWPLVVLAALRVGRSRSRWWILAGAATALLVPATWRLAHGGWIWLALLLWPISVVLTRRCLPERRPLVLVIGAISTLALVVCLRLTYTQPQLAFFASPTRAWEFGLGGLAVLVVGATGAAGARARLTSSLLSWCGLAAVISSGVVFTPFTPFPGAAAIIPVVGTAAVLVAGSIDASAGAGRLLAMSPLQQIGRLSYSWYLWHWPALVFLEIVVPSPSPALRGACVLASLGVAWITYRRVENPIRRSRRLTPRPLVTLAGAAALTALTVGLASGTGALSREALANPVQARLAKPMDADPFYERGCVVAWGDATLRACEIGDTTAGPTASIVLMGDSHAAHWRPALERAAASHRWRVTTLIKVSCPSAAVSFFNSRLRRLEHECDSWRSSALSWIATHRPDVVVMSNMAGYVAVLDREGWYSQHTPDEWRDGLGRTFARLEATGAHTLWLRVTPLMRFNVPECLARAAEHPWFRGRECGRARKMALSDELWTAERNAARGLSSVKLADLSQFFCDSTTCPPERKGQVLYRDNNHIAVAYAESLAPELAALIEASLARK